MTGAARRRTDDVASTGIENDLPLIEVVELTYFESVYIRLLLAANSTSLR